MINNWNINLIGGGEEDIKRFVNSIISDLKKFLNLPQDFRVYISNNFDEAMEKKYGESDFGTQPKTRKIDVFYEDISEDFEDNSIFFQEEEFNKIFNDTECGVRLSPMIKNFKFSLTIDISSKSKVILTSCINKIRERDSLIRKNFRHNNVEVVSYLDNRVIVLLDEINKKRKLLYPNETLSDYIKKYRDPSLKTVNSGGANNKNILGVEHRYSNINGRLVTEANSLKAEYSTEDKDWTISLTYEVNACLPIRLNVVYPSLIFNQVIHRRMIQNIDPYKHLVFTPKYVDQYDQLVTIEKGLYTNESNLYATIPEWDTSVMKQVNNYFKIIFTALIGMVGQDPLVPILNLKELGKAVKIKDEFIEFLEDGEYQYVTQLLKSIFIINLYENERILSNDYLTIDENLDIFYVGPVDLKKIYRLSFSICINPNIITKEAYARATNSKILAALINNIIVINDIYNYELFRGGKMDIYIGSKDIPIVAKTVQTSYIQAAGFLESKK